MRNALYTPVENECVRIYALRGQGAGRSSWQNLARAVKTFGLMKFSQGFSAVVLNKSTRIEIELAWVGAKAECSYRKRSADKYTLAAMLEVASGDESWVIDAGRQDLIIVELCDESDADRAAHVVRGVLLFLVP